MSSGMSVIHSDVIYPELIACRARRQSSASRDNCGYNEGTAIESRKKMRNIRKLRFSATLCWLLIVPLCLVAGNRKKAPEQFSALSFVVLRDSDGEPMKNASVVIHFLRKDGSEEPDGLQLKTDAEGRAGITDIPYGNLRVQVIAPRLQTYGDDFVVNQAQQEFVIRLKPPAGQVSLDK